MNAAPTVLAGTGLALAAGPALLFVRNLRAFRTPAPAAGPTPPVSVLIPARDEAGKIGRAVRAALASLPADGEVVVLDDHSSDGTAAEVLAVANEDSRVRLETAPPLPPGWNGKQHACCVLALAARHEVLVFIDADVTLSADAVPRLVAELQASQAALLSGFPRQTTATWLQAAVLPLMHVVLLGFLPLRRMRRSVRPAYAAGCGQLFVTRRAAYRAAGGHAAIRASRHDGLTLPRAYRTAGLRTDVCDATTLALCRMYDNNAGLWRGLTKNTTEGLGRPRLIVPATLVLIGGQVLPVVLLLWALAARQWLPTTLAALACAAGWLQRGLAAWRFRQSWLGPLLHPAGVMVLVAAQWVGLCRKLAGRPVAWKGRRQPAG